MVVVVLPSPAGVGVIAVACSVMLYKVTEREWWSGGGRPLQLFFSPGGRGAATRSPTHAAPPRPIGGTPHAGGDHPPICLVALLLGVSDKFGQGLVIAAVGAIMIIYVLVGGMKGTTWVQIVKAVMLLGGATILAGWAKAAQGRGDGPDRIRRGIDDWLATGSRPYPPYYLGLLAEEYDPRAKRQLGNFPQGFSHIALINTAHNLISRLGRAEQRAERDGRSAKARARRDPG